MPREFYQVVRSQQDGLMATHSTDYIVKLEDKLKNLNVTFLIVQQQGKTSTSNRKIFQNIESWLEKPGIGSSHDLRILGSFTEVWQPYFMVQQQWSPNFQFYSGNNL